MRANTEVYRSTVTDIINLSPAYALEMDILKRMWTGKDLSYKHMKVFGCQAFTYILKNERSKLDGKA